MLDINPIESLPRVWVMKHGKFLAVPAIALTAIAVLLFVLWGIHIALRQTGSEEGIWFVTRVASWDGAGTAALSGAVLLIVLWVGIVVCSVMAKTDEQTPNINLPVVLSVTDYAIGIAGYRGYPDKPAGAAMLCLWVVISPASTPINTLDLLVGSSPPIHSIDWTGKLEAAFRVWFDVSEWHHKGEEQVELMAKAGSDTHSSGRKSIYFNVEPFGRHPI